MWRNNTTPSKPIAFNVLPEVKLSPGFQALALKLQEQSTELSSSDVCRWLSDACKEVEGYAYYVDHFGDGESGDVIYSCGGDLKRAPYSIRQVGGKWTATIEDDQAVDVLPRTTYEEEADEEDHIASMEAARLYTKGDRAPLIERFISKDERAAADAGSFAGKGKSFPILKPGDVMAAVRSMGRAGAGNHSTATLKKNIIAIAKKKGWSKYLPKAWQDGEEDTNAGEAAEIEILGDCIPLREGAVGQDGTAYLKLIAPGWGSSGYYPAEVLERDGPQVFKAGTKNFWNHQTDAEEAARPEGDLRDLASVLSEDAHYDRSGPAGPGLYAKAKVFEQFRQPVDDLAKHIGMSIRASGKAREGEADGKKGRIIEQISRGVSVDYVTTPGAGGKILQLFEAARSTSRNSPRTGGGDDMDAAEFKKLHQRLSLREAADHVDEKLADIRLPAAAIQRVRTRCIENAPLNAEGMLDTKKLDELIEREMKDEADYLGQITGRRLVVNMGVSTDLSENGDESGLSKKERKRLRKMQEANGDTFEATMKELGRTMGLGKDGRRAFTEGRGAA